MGKVHCFPVLTRISDQSDDFENFDAPKCDLAKTCCACPEKSVLYNFHEKRTVFPLWREFEASFTFWKLWRSKMRFGQDVLRMTWKERFVQFSWKAHCFPVLANIWGKFQDFENFGAQKLDLAKTCRARPEKRVLYNFLGKRTVFRFWRNAHDLKRASCTIFMEGALFSRFRRNFRPAWRFSELWRSKMRFRRNLLRITWKERVVQFSWKAHCFSALKRIWGQFHDFENFGAQK